MSKHITMQSEKVRVFHKVTHHRGYRILCVNTCRTTRASSWRVSMLRALQKGQNGGMAVEYFIFGGCRLG
eukprot:CFRG4719T1